MVSNEAYEPLRPAANKYNNEMQVSTALATILVISCHSCSIVKLIKVYITEPSCICSLLSQNVQRNSVLSVYVEFMVTPFIF